MSRLIAGRGVDEGVLQLQVSAPSRLALSLGTLYIDDTCLMYRSRPSQLSQKKPSTRLLSMLALARDHAVAKGMDRGKLVIAQSWTSKGPSIKRIDIKGRGRRGIKHHNLSKLHVLLAEGDTKEQKRREHKREGWRVSCRGISDADAVGVGKALPIRNAKTYWSI